MAYAKKKLYIIDIDSHYCNTATQIIESAEQATQWIDRQEWIRHFIFPNISYKQLYFNAFVINKFTNTAVVRGSFLKY